VPECDSCKWHPHTSSALYPSTDSKVDIVEPIKWFPIIETCISEK
jgi:hypothetical protein